jgi:cyclic pyranopterin monophosphate synthase
MVDVTPKEPTHRRAVARCKVFMQPATTAAIANREVKKGDVLAVARVAGIQAAKRTADMIPLCHPLLVGAVNINFEIGDDFIAVEANVDTVDRTGVEMEALHACSVAALTIYDMCKSADRGMVIGDLALWEKTGGRSGNYRRAELDVDDLHLGVAPDISDRPLDVDVDDETPAPTGVAAEDVSFPVTNVVES